MGRVRILKKINLAVVGPSDSVALITEIAQEREVLNILSLVYQDASEVPGIIKKMDDYVDVWLFSGIVPYLHAKDSAVTLKPLYYIPHTGSSLYRALLQILDVENLEVGKISFDTFNKKEIEESFADIPIVVPEIYVNDYSNIISAEEITHYHYQLWLDGKSNIAVTCFLSTYNELRELGVPTFRIWPTRDNIRTMLTIAISKVQEIRSKGSQIAIHHIAIDKYDDLIAQVASNYEIRRIELKLYELLINYTEMLKGSILMLGEGHYTIYSTRGIIENITKDFTVMPLFEEITSNMALNVSGGIGFGPTAYAANENAHSALALARQAGYSKWMVVLDDKSVIGPLSSATYLQYAIKSDDQNMQNLAVKLNIRTTTLMKMLAALKRFDSEIINAEDLALYLSITTRSARRLLSNLINNGLAISAGEEGVGKGRPRNLYRILIDKIVAVQNN